jgi:hypothetical protein
MGQRNVRVVVGQGDLEHAGSLRAVLERDDFDVVGDVSAASQLEPVLTDEQPDIVVLDDVIGVGAVELAARIVPDARLVVVWPAAVMPIAGAVRVDPTEVGATLGATVALVAGLSGLGSSDRPEWIERVKKDPATLREMLAAGGALPTRPSVTELQRRRHRLHPSPSAAKRVARMTDVAAASVVPIAVAASRRDGPASTPGDAAAPTVPPTVLGAAWNRRLGTISLGGAAVAGALMIALALGPHTPSIVSAEPFPAYVSHGGGPAFTLGGETQTSGDDGVQTAEGGGRGGNPTSGGLATSDSGFTSGTTPHGSIGSIGGGNRTGAGNGTGGSSGGSGTGTGGTGGTGAPGGPHSTSSHLPGAHGAGKAGAPGWQGDAPGRSGNHNPHGGPPGHDAVHGSSPENANGGSGVNNGGAQGSSGSHGNGHGYGQAGGHRRSAAAHRHKR